VCVEFHRDAHGDSPLDVAIVYFQSDVATFLQLAGGLVFFRPGLKTLSDVVPILSIVR
jgi:hypothetical protein